MRFDSHDFIIKLAKHNQPGYVEALEWYRVNVNARPFKPLRNALPACYDNLASTWRIADRQFERHPFGRCVECVVGADVVTPLEHAVPWLTVLPALSPKLLALLPSNRCKIIGTRALTKNDKSRGTSHIAEQVMKLLERGLDAEAALCLGFECEVAVLIWTNQVIKHE